MPRAQASHVRWQIEQGRCHLRVISGNPGAQWVSHRLNSATHLVRIWHSRVLFGHTHLLILPGVGWHGPIDGEPRQFDSPAWGPLEKVLCSDDLCGHFMWMLDIELEDGVIINEYKHRWTRQCLNLAGDGRAFIYVGGERYQEADLTLAIGAVFLGWESCEPTLEERVALRFALGKTLSAAD